MVNLEPLAAEAAARMVEASRAKDSFILLNKALMVLAEQGLFAFGLFLASRKENAQNPKKCEKVLAERIDRAVQTLLTQAGLMSGSNEPGSLSTTYYRALTQTRDAETPVQALHRIMLTKQFVEVALTYGRYQAKARGD